MTKPYHEQHKTVKLHGIESNRLIQTQTHVAQNGTHVHMWDAGGCTINEDWHIETLRKLSDSQYVVTISIHGKYLNVDGGRTENGSKFHLWGDVTKAEDANDKASQWLIEYIQPDTVIIKTMLCDRYINADNWSSKHNGGIVHLWGNRDDSLAWGNNKWKLIGSHEDEEEEKEEWDMCERRFVSHEETSSNVEIEIGKIAQMICKAVQAYFGDVFSLVQIADNVTLSFSTSSASHLTDDKIIMHQGTNYLLIKLQSKTGQNKIKTGVFKKDKTSKVYIAEICCLRPNNKAAEDKCKKLMNQKVNDVLNDMHEKF